MQPTMSDKQFQFVERRDQVNRQEPLLGTSRSSFQEAREKLLKNKLAMAGMIIIVSLILMAVIGPFLIPYSYSEQSLLDTDLPPDLQHWFGTDDLGRDIFARTWVGARISLFIGITAALIDLLIGVVYGAIAGYAGGKTEEVMMRIADLLYSLPHLLVTILLMVVLKPGLLTIILAMTATGWIGMARLVRGQVLQLKEMEYVIAAKALGSSFPRILFKHLIPNTVGPITVAMTLTIPGAIFSEATLSFLGLGVPVPLASWGTMTSDGLVGILTGQPWRILFPAILISLTMFSFNVLGDGLRDALDPRHRK
ncbi:ABC transporter permease [Brevibacillus centrosporus]|uniref:ABC transporter permease n=1 Tax=Brevibacillus centrosporus TaxID=54910 RepID=UPI00114197BD|nr:ABC transporter permease [Brevibacillus centrosporus]MEC2127833.1 ABC transporter permease [Brevibacillus centrosporus]GED32073.1 oligopeptide transport system permease protein OppC [Brevibacillus centrosporus]